MLSLTLCCFCHAVGQASIRETGSLHRYSTAALAICFASISVPYFDTIIGRQLCRHKASIRMCQTQMNCKYYDTVHDTCIAIHCFAIYWDNSLYTNCLYVDLSVICFCFRFHSLVVSYLNSLFVLFEFRPTGSLSISDRIQGRSDHRLKSRRPCTTSCDRNQSTAIVVVSIAVSGYNPVAVVQISTWHDACNARNTVKLVACLHWCVYVVKLTRLSST